MSPDDYETFKFFNKKKKGKPPTKVSLIGKELAHNSRDREFEFCCRCEDFVGRRPVSIFISTHKTLRHDLTLMTSRNLIHLNFFYKKKSVFKNNKTKILDFKSIDPQIMIIKK